MEFRDLEYFAVVAKYGHEGRAADSLDISQSALSKSLRRIESTLGTKIVERTPKGIKLTTTGMALLSRVKQLRLARDDVMREVSDLREGHAGHLRIGVTPGFSEELTGLASGALFKQAPRVTLKIDVVNPDALLPGLHDGAFDLTVGGVSDASSHGLVHEYLIDDEFVVYASGDHRLAGRKRITLIDLAQEQWIKTAAAGYSWHALHRVFAESGLAPPVIALESNSTTIRLHAAANSDLLYFNSRRFMSSIRRPFNLVELHVKELTWLRRNSVSYRKAAYISPAARRFIEVLKAAAKGIADEE